MKEEDRSSLKGLKKFMVTDIREKKNGHINPVIVTFQNGELNERHAADCKVTLTEGKDGKTDVEIRTAYDHVFKDSNFNNRIYPNQIIAIRNKKTNKVKLVEVDSAVLINSALISSPESDTQVTENNTDAKALNNTFDNTKDTQTSEYHKDVKTLNKTFGGKKLVARLDQREKLNMNLTPIAEDVMKVVEDITVEENISLNETETESIVHLLPPCHRDVKIVSEVYNLYEIITKEELNALKEGIALLEESETNIKECSKFFLEHFAEAKKSETNLENRLAGILFTECLIKFLKIPSKKIGTKNVVLCPFSPVIHNKLLNEFCVKTEASVTRPLTMRDKCVCYIIAIGLICCDYKINLKALSLSTAVHFSRVARLARVVGAVPQNENTYILKLPLPALPKSSKGRIKRK